MLRLPRIAPPRLALFVSALLLPAAGYAQTALQPPVSPACVSSPFGPRVLPNRPLAGTFHPGVDLPAPLGAPVRAVAPGTLIRVQRRGVGGLEMLVQHDGFIGVYSHLGLIAPPILEGRRTIAAGEKLGTVGRSGLTYGPHLYFGMLVNDRPVDPARFIAITPCAGGGTPIRDAKIPPSRAYGTRTHLALAPTAR
ncbi:MAG TPA: M23 family metallopeptidase [Rhodopila sp.]|uniref:M23 family metallopeptidase n=1 Tax=Rhodopila sp. TaxID=2480087 RepID=UPI002BDB7FD8|nr:M23 family metallopeptidase [Rhodopila sp.]HVY14948.1 M23 family metallopeptidase [Rhodopila sp.]